jgi:hypothetical protein
MKQNLPQMSRAEDKNVIQTVTTGDARDNACDHILPERYQQLSRQRHDCRLLTMAAIAPDPFF